MSSTSVVWHDVENGSYEADLPFWRELADAAGGMILDLGAGTGRVAADLAARGHELVALDADPEVLAVLEERVPNVITVRADVRDFKLGRTFALVIAPMQLAQILGGRAGRVAMLERVHAHLSTGGTFGKISPRGRPITSSMVRPVAFSVALFAKRNRSEPAASSNT